MVWAQKESDAKTLPQLHAEVERLKLEIEILSLTAQRDMALSASKAEEWRKAQKAA